MHAAGISGSRGTNNPVRGKTLRNRGQVIRKPDHSIARGLRNNALVAVNQEHANGIRNDD
jgi:hypothetical protein